MSNFEQPNPYGGYIAWHVVLLIGICLPQVWHWVAKFLSIHQMERESEPMPIWLTVLLLGCTGLIGIALIASWSRGAWLAAVAGCGAIGFFFPLRRRYGFALIFAGLLGLVRWNQARRAQSPVLT